MKTLKDWVGIVLLTTFVLIIIILGPRLYFEAGQQDADREYYHLTRHAYSLRLARYHQEEVRRHQLMVRDKEIELRRIVNDRNNDLQEVEKLIEKASEDFGDMSDEFMTKVQELQATWKIECESIIQEIHEGYKARDEYVTFLASHPAGTFPAGISTEMYKGFELLVTISNSPTGRQTIGAGVRRTPTQIARGY